MTAAENLMKELDSTIQIEPRKDLTPSNNQ